VCAAPVPDQQTRLKEQPDAADNPIVEFSMSPGRAVWTMVVAATAIVSVLTLVGPFTSSTWVQPELLFSITTVAAATCVVAATIVIALADRRNMAEIGLLGSALMAASVMPLVHGLVTPDVLYADNEAFRASSFLALPVAVAVASPLLFRSSAFGRWAARRWRDWTLLALLAVFILGAVVVFYPAAIVVPGPRDSFTVVMSLGMAAALLALSLRQLSLYELGRRPSNFIASISIVLLAATALLPLVDTPYGAGFWWLHVSGSLGVMGACIGMGVSKRLSQSAQDILAPVLVREPLVAFELGLSPVVHRFVADLEMKDEITRDHVVRTGELALRVGERMGLRGSELRRLGLAAMLHDVGKIYTPDEILKKPASLTVEEYEVIKIHPVDGERMLLAEPSLAEAAPIVRSHHERVDGGGYPDGLVGDQIPLPSRIIAVCDAVDAMTHDRQYRKAMPMQMAFAILREHAGSQWDPDVVKQVMLTLPAVPVISRLDGVGRPDEDELASIEIPDDVHELLEAVDAEI
jgi:HD-GYP domain-containing protein (c-di-GMP phosphodiesterase class II)